MGTILEAVIPADEFALQETSQALSGIVFRLERVVAQDADRILPLVWIAGIDRDRLEAALREDSSVDGFELVTDLDGSRLYQINWIDRIDALVTTIVNEEAVLLEASGSAENWELKFLFIDRDAIRRVRDHFETAGISFRIHHIYDQKQAALGSHGLTAKQHHTLSVALDRGYYRIPRDANASAIAEDLDISHQALSEQLRRAHATVVADAIGSNASVLSDPSADE